MCEATRLAAAIERYGTSKTNGWMCPLPEAVAGLTAAEAARVPGPGLNSIWALVNHIRFEHECIINRLQGMKVDPESLGHEYGWPSPGAPDDESAWQEACCLAIARNAELAALLKALPEEHLAAASPSGRDSLWLHGLLAHTAYHVGQIVLLRRLTDDWEALQWLAQ
ncbi:MAG TPA: DinB family protein [Symbiobacteriaceae bacterium]|nr:DinB family protein [Symbiobacteriaceae bacterium]